MSIFMRCCSARCLSGLYALRQRTLQRFHRLRLFDFLAAFLAGAARVIVPKIEHRLAEVLNDIRAIEVNVFH